jgi:acyl-coenzyme A thioesterase PaaI-like protein
MSKAIPRDDAPVLSAKEAEDTITSNLPPVDHHCEIVEAVGPNSLRIRLPFKDDFTGAERWQDGSGQIFSGPMVMGLADTAMYCCVMAALGKGIIPVMINLHITFLKPAVGRDLIAEARIVRRGARLHYLECWLTSDGDQTPCAHVTSTYRVSRRQQ